VSIGDYEVFEAVGWLLQEAHHRDECPVAAWYRETKTVYYHAAGIECTCGLNAMRSRFPDGPSGFSVREYERI